MGKGVRNDDSARVLRRSWIEEARRADPSVGYAVHLRGALDYRDWFEFNKPAMRSSRRTEREQVWAATEDAMRAMELAAFHGHATGFTRSGAVAWCRGPRPTALPSS